MTESTPTDEPETALVGPTKTSKMSEHDESDGAEAWMTVEEAAAVLQLTARQVNRYGHGDDARLRTQRVSRRVLYHRQDVLALADELHVALKPKVASVPKAELVPVGEMVEVFERQQQQIAMLSREVGRLEGRLEQQRLQLADVQDVQTRLEAAEAERAALQAKLHDAERTIALLTGLQEAEAAPAPAQPGLLGRWWQRLRR